MAGYRFNTVWKKGINISYLMLYHILLWHFKSDLLAEVVSEEINAFNFYQIFEVDNTEASLETCLLQYPQPTKIKEMTKEDRQYKMLIEQILVGFPKCKRNINYQHWPHWGVRNYLSVEDGLILKGCQIVIPKYTREWYWIDYMNHIKV